MCWEIGGCVGWEMDKGLCCFGNCMGLQPLPEGLDSVFFLCVSEEQR